MIEIAIVGHKIEISNMGGSCKPEIIFTHISGRYTRRQRSILQFSLAISIYPSVGMNSFFINTKKRNGS